MKNKKKMQKGIIIVGLAALFLLGIHMLTAEKTKGKCGENLRWVYEDGVLTISGTGDMYYEGKAPWSKWRRDDLVRVVIGEGCTSICSNAFTGCYHLTEVVLPDSLEYIGEEAFRYCSALTEAEFPDSLEKIGEEAFMGCLLGTYNPAGIPSERWQGCVRGLYFPDTGNFPRVFWKD